MGAMRPPEDPRASAESPNGPSNAFSGQAKSVVQIGNVFGTVNLTSPQPLIEAIEGMTVTMRQLLANNLLLMELIENGISDETVVRMSEGLLEANEEFERSKTRFEFHAGGLNPEIGLSPATVLLARTGIQVIHDCLVDAMQAVDWALHLHHEPRDFPADLAAGYEESFERMPDHAAMAARVNEAWSIFEDSMREVMQIVTEG